MIRPAPPFLYRTTALVVCPEALPDVLDAMRTLAEHALRHEPATRLCAWLQDDTRPTNILRVGVFDDEDAERAHQASLPARRLACLLQEAAAEPPAEASWHPLAGI